MKASLYPKAHLTLQGFATIEEALDTERSWRSNEAFYLDSAGQPQLYLLGIVSLADGSYALCLSTQEGTFLRLEGHKGRYPV